MIHRDRLARPFVLLHVLVFVGFGLAFMVAPAPLARLLDISLESGSAVADLRAMYGGLSLGMGLAFAVGLKRAAWLGPVIFAIGASSACMLASRLLTMVGHPVSAPIYGFALSEALSLAGVDAVWQTAKFQGDKNLAFALWGARSFGDVGPGDRAGWGVKAQYPNDLWFLEASFKQFGDSLVPALGYLPRPGSRLLYQTTASVMSASASGLTIKCRFIRLAGG